MSERQEFITVVAVLIVGIIIARTTGMLGPMVAPNLHHAPDTDIDPSRHRHDGTQPIGESDAETDSLARTSMCRSCVTTFTPQLTYLDRPCTQMRNTL